MFDKKLSGLSIIVKESHPNLATRNYHHLHLYDFLEGLRVEDENRKSMHMEDWLVL